MVLFRSTAKSWVGSGTSFIGGRCCAMLTVYEGISLMIGFASLIVAVIAVGISSDKKK